MDDTRPMRILISLSTALFGIGVPTALGFAWSDYNLSSDFLSELGAKGAPQANFMSYAGFLPAGVLWALAVLSLLSIARSKLLWIGGVFLLGTSISYIGAAFFPCDAGCPVEGSSSQMMHNLLGLIGYLASPVGLALIGAHFLRRKQVGAAAASFATAAATVIGFVMMASPDMDSTRGIWQRLADFSLFIWLVGISVLVSNHSPPSPNQNP